MSKHTPGPWYSQPIGPSYNRQQVIYARGECHDIAIVYNHDDHAEANATLIAAAPAMLDILKRLQREMLEAQDPDDYSGPPDPYLDEITSLIWDVEGEA